MSEIRGIPRRSKTAIIVVLVVFLQMLALGVVGVGAIKEDRVRGRQRQLRQNENQAREELARVRDRAIRDVTTVLNEALSAGDWRRLAAAESVQDGTSADERLVRAVFQFNRADSIKWLDTEYLLWQAPSQIGKESALYAKRAGIWQALIEAIRAPQSSADRVADCVAFLSRYPLLIEDVSDEQMPPRLWPSAAGWAHNLVKQDGLLQQALAAGDELEAGTVRQAILFSLMVEGLNRDRPELDDANRRFVAGIEREVLDALARVPERLMAGLDDEVRAFLQYRDQVLEPQIQKHLLSFYAAGRSALLRTLATKPFVGMAGPELFAMKRDTVGRFRVARLDPEALEKMIRARIQPEVFQPLGMGIRVMANTGGEEPDTANLLETQRIEAGEFKLPFQLRRYKIADVVGEGAGRSEVWYLLIITLAALGLLFGGLGLFRLWRRDVRLAQLKADFVSNLSHELKTPLTSISLFTEMLREGKFDDAPDDRQEAFEVLDQEAQRLQRIVQRMIETARNEAQGVPYNLEAADLNRPILEAANRFRRIVTEPGLDLHITLSTEPLPMMLDVSAMDDAVTNLLSNAWKYKRGAAARIQLETRRRGRHAEVIVTDDGIGIPRNERKRVFETFYRAEQFLTQPVQGTGLGLALVRTIVRAHRGRVRLDPNDQGDGTVFSMRFPLDRKAAAICAARPSIDDDNVDSPNARNASEGIGNTGATA